MNAAPSVHSDVIASMNSANFNRLFHSNGEFRTGLTPSAGPPMMPIHGIPHSASAANYQHPLSALNQNHNGNHHANHHPNHSLNGLGGNQSSGFNQTSNTAHIPMGSHGQSNSGGGAAGHSNYNGQGLGSGPPNGNGQQSGNGGAGNESNGPPSNHVHFPNSSQINQYHHLPADSTPRAELLKAAQNTDRYGICTESAVVDLKGKEVVANRLYEITAGRAQDPIRSAMMKCVGQGLNNKQRAINLEGPYS